MEYKNAVKFIVIVLYIVLTMIEQLGNVKVATKPCNRKIMVKVETERENSQQALKTMFYLNRFTSHRITKTCSEIILFKSFQLNNVFNIK